MTRHTSRLHEVSVKRQGWGESCRIRLREREAYVLKGARTSPNGEVRESKHAVEPGANSTGPCGRPHGRQYLSMKCVRLRHRA